MVVVVVVVDIVPEEKRKVTSVSNICFSYFTDMYVYAFTLRR